MPRAGRKPKNRLNGVPALPVTQIFPPLVPAVQPLRLDLGCGPNPRDGFEGVDILPFGGKVKHVLDLRVGRWPWKDGSVDEVHASHFLEHLTNFNGKWERVRFFNELWRVLKPGGTATLIFPHWCSTRYYGDPTHKEPFSEMGFYYLLRSWRLGDPATGAGANAPHTDISNNPDGYSCDFDAVWGNALRPEWTVRNQDTQAFAGQWYKEAIQDLHATLTAKKG